MTFKKKSLRVVVPLDPVEGERYTEPVRDEESEDELDCIYQITTQNQDPVHFTLGRRVVWEHDSTCIVDSNEEIERWQNRLQEATKLNCNMVTRSLRYIITEER